MSVTVRRLANVLAVLLLVAIVAPFVVYAVPQVAGADHSFVVLTASMTPAIAPGDAVVVAERDPATIREGDVVTFLRGDGEVPVTHRVVGVVDSGGDVAFETKGDANDDVDAGLVPAGNVIGVVLLTIPYIGYVIQFANSEYGFLALIVLPFGLLAANEAWAFYRRSKAAGASFGDDARGETAVSGDDGLSEGIERSAENAPFVITLRTLEGAFLALLVVTPYNAYVAYNWQSVLPVSVAIASGALLVGIAATLLPAWFRGSERDGASEADSPADAPERLEPGPPDELADIDGVVLGFDGGTAPEAAPADDEWIPAVDRDGATDEVVDTSGSDESESDEPRVGGVADGSVTDPEVNEDDN
ncbi:MAG: signal peptidase I [Haloferacaceae archaeon]